MVKLAIAGLGRIGKSHAENLLQTPGCEVVGACSIVKSELDWAQEHLGVVQLWDNYEEMLRQQDCEAVFLATSSNVHGEQIIAALEAGKHVFCEKPLGTSVADCEKTSRIIAQYQDKQIFMLGFVRRFDPAYSYAKKKVAAGAIGTPYMVRSQTSDHLDFAPFQVEFTATSGGIFHDMSVHDIDLLRWYLGSEPLSVHALSSSFAFPEFGRIGDADNAIVTCEFEGGKIGVLQANRCAAHGHNTFTEIYGTEGILRIGFRPTWADVEILDAHGQRGECVYTFFDRFSEAFRLEVREFIRCINEKKGSPICYRDGLQATKIAEACTRSMKEQRSVLLSEF
ncbi:MAG: Gfo/Idh/MocA family oxidoreductase [Spirochaetota bacterium]